MKLLKILALMFAVAILSAGIGVYFLLYPYAGFQGEVFVDIPRGASTRAIAQKLADSGVISSPWPFLALRALRSGVRLQAGEYRFAEPASTYEVYDRIGRGDVFYYELKIPEGYNIFDIAASLEKMGLMKSGDFLTVAREPDLIRDLAPEAPSLEGYLFPDTYRITRRTTATELCRALTQRFREAWRELKTDANVHRTVTLASLVEKETGVAEERPMVAAVFANRLRMGMKLDCDPTTVYAALLQGRYKGTLHRSDLDSDHPYNTYRHVGLPPGPIANPGLASLRAALAPAETDFVYFVAHGDGSGRHSFSKDIGAHAAAVERYRSAQKQDVKKQLLREYLDQRSPAVVGEAEWRELRERLAPVSESYLRQMLRDSEVAVEPPFGGVRQSTFDKLEESLVEMEAVYDAAKAAGDREKATACRRAVIEAKDRARWATRSEKVAEDKRLQKAEMLEWMLVWLENPSVFPSWIKLRRARMS